MTLRRPSCNGLPDCNPPNSFVSKMSGAAVSATLIFYLAEFLNDKLSNPDASLINSSFIVSSVVVAALFMFIFITWARRPQPAPGWQKGGLCVTPVCNDPRPTPKMLKRYLNALIFGIAMGLLIIVPRAIIDFDSNTFAVSDLILGNIIRLVAFVVAAIVMRFILQMKESDISPSEIKIFWNYKYTPPLDTSSND